MASATLARKMQEEATCSICLEYLTQPVTVDCGHNFCRACIIRYCKLKASEFGLTLPCPQCRALFWKRQHPPNRQLANIIETLKQLELQLEKAQKENLCETHQEELKLFCEEDREAICMVCRESQAHRAHAVLSIEEAAQDYKVKIQGALGPLRKELEQVLELMAKEETKSMEWQEKVENRRRSITCEFKKLKQFLNEEEQLLLQRLAEEERETQQRLGDNVTDLSVQKSTVQQLITELEEKCQQPAAELLKGVESALIRSKNVKLHAPETVLLPALKNVYKICLDMREMLTRFTVDVTLDPDTAHPELVLSEDRKRVRDGDTCQDLPDNPERFDTYPIVLGTEGFTGGRRYWEVEVGEKPGWELGVCRESVSRKEPVITSPENGYWVMWLWNGEYAALTYPLIPFPVSVRPRRVGIFLDYEAGEVSFYNVTDRSHLFTFTDTFSGTLRPYFCPGLSAGGKNAAPLIICPVPAQAGGNLCP
ncbi:E3 ubiquitin-protein ligase TRIM39-like [Emydura macquarii macquarii]|uniref:E3 ubiquitin-protein ligase TRIM39-like n=1 Tax=Emydura macquarii macquarii TaxID=1129001 RepID=UPI003529FAA8